MAIDSAKVRYSAYKVLMPEGSAMPMADEAILLTEGDGNKVKALEKLLIEAVEAGYYLGIEA